MESSYSPAIPNIIGCALIRYRCALLIIFLFYCRKVLLKMTTRVLIGGESRTHHKTNVVVGREEEGKEGMVEVDVAIEISVKDSGIDTEVEQQTEEIVVVT